MLKKIKELKREDPFKAMFPINPLDLQAITDHMKQHGFDESQPVVVWKSTNQIVDGFTRIAAAITNNIEEIHVIEKDFVDEIAAIKYTVHLQRDRRNLTPAQFAQLLKTVDSRLTRGGDRKSEAFKKVNYKPLDDDEVEDAIPTNGDSAELTADILGVSPSTVKKTRKILDSDDPNTQQQLNAGASIDTVYKGITKKEKQAKEKNTKGGHKLIKVTEKDSWAGWMLNPIVGCKQGCDDCMCVDMTTEVYGSFDPQFFPERLSAMKNTKIPSGISPKTRNVLMCEMGDMLNPDIEDGWIEQTIEAMFDAPQWNFLIRTRFPARYNSFNWPDNTWLGAVVTNQEQAEAAAEAFSPSIYKNCIQFLSCYPLREEISFKPGMLSNISWIIIGPVVGNNSLKPSQPEWRWVENIVLKARENDCKVYFMSNLKVAPKEIPDVYIPEVIQKKVEM